MEGRLWLIVLSLLPSEQERSRKQTYSSRVILMVGLWAILHDRPFGWAANIGFGPNPDKPEPWRMLYNFLPFCARFDR